MSSKSSLPNSPMLDVQSSRKQQPLSRSPHPYHRHSVEVPDRFHIIDSDNLSSRLVCQSEQLIPSDRGNDTDYFVLDNHKRRKISSSPNESGTEADDERPPLLKGLPPPPLRPRKGLKGSGSSGFDATPSPLLTPSSLDHGISRPASALGPTQRTWLTNNQTRTDEEILHIREKRSKQRQAELLRRVLETGCLAGVGCLTLYRARANLGHEVLVYIASVVGIYLAFPLRFLWRQRRQIFEGGLSVIRWHVPVAFDPAPLLYPILLPVLVSFSLNNSQPHTSRLSNFVLSICSLPPGLIPFQPHGASSMHWLLSILPVAFESRAFEHSDSPVLDLHHSISSPIRPENLILLFPLHQALVRSLGFLSTTSLLPAELQLLAVTLINLLLFSTSPQALILLALLWIGGISIFVTCRYVLQWSVEIARVPNWRFRRSKNATYERNVFFRGIDDSLGGILGRSRFLKDSRVHSDTDDDQDLSVQISPHRSPGKQNNAKESKTIDLQNNCGSTVPAVKEMSSIFPVELHSPGNSLVKSLQAERSQPRRYTLPSYGSVSSYQFSLPLLNLNKRSTILLTRPKSFLSLTSSQATVLKWLYAIYVYVIILVIIWLPIRSYISGRSLHGNEPVGWALGYIFGDIPAFRFQIVWWNLERWVCLPPREIPQPHTLCRGERFRHLILGTANTRLLICFYCVTSIVVGMSVVLKLSTVAEVDTRRKVFHGMMVVMFLPTIFLDPAFAALALGLILAVFLLLDLFRASQLPPISKPLTYFLAPYVDGRDHRGPIIVSHIFLLIGCAIPLWLSLAAIERVGTGAFEGWDVATRDSSMVSGVVCVGMGDAAASLIGRRYGRRRWPWSGGKSVEGSTAFAVAVVIGLSLARIWLLVGGRPGDGGDSWTMTLGKAGIAASGASLTEAVLTGGNDNVVVPIVLWLLVRGLEI